MKILKILFLSTLSFVYAKTNIVLIPMNGILIPIVIAEEREVFSEDITNMITRNNEIRREVFTGAEIKWNIAIEASAQVHADYLAQNNLFTHSGTSYGENLYASGAEASFVDAVNAWYREKAEYNTNTKTCNTGKTCGHYTQLIWKDTLEVGCAKSSSASWKTIVVCQYNPPGNYIGQTAF
ncbi:SCP-like family protein [hydrothermal vent metagenome]|uniref:SCP-like family protein n=1 Tax=hydrothermal vent metagenome TaxID=652676 RepID=A0A1W1CJ58_9ZZZZ